MIGAFKGDTRSLDYGSYVGKPFPSFQGVGYSRYTLNRL